MPKIKHFECSRCHEAVSADKPQTVCPKCAGSLYVRYDLSSLQGLAAGESVEKAARQADWAGMWRYRLILPEAEPVTLGEGWTPMLRSRRHPGVFLKEEGANPTGSFKARGLRSCGGNGSEHLHAERCSLRELCGSGHVRGQRNAGERIDFRLRAYGGRAEGERRVVRYLDAQGAVPHRGQENHGLRTRRATGLGIPRRRVLSDRGRSGIDWNVESVWRARKTGLGQTGETAQDDCRTVRRLRAHCSRVRPWRKSQPDVGERGNLCGGPARSQALRRLHHA